MHRPSLVGLLLCAALGACARDRPDDPGVTRADSAGIRLISSSGPDRPLAWRLQEIDVLRDSVGEPWLFTAVQPSRVLTDRAGRTYVLEREPAIRRFGRDGRYERSIGRAGGAPGEMRGPTALLQQGDTLAVLDLGRSAVVRWDPEFHPLNDLPLRGGLEGVTKLAFRTGGVWVQRSRFDGKTATEELFADTLADAPLHRFDGDESQGRILRVCGDRLAFRQPVYFSPAMQWTNAGPRILVNLGPDYELKLYEGPRLIASIRRSIAMRAPTVDDVRRLYPEGLRFQFPGTECTVPLAELTQGATFAPLLPAVNGLALLSDATMWVRRSLAPERPVTLDVFGSDGAYAGTLSGHHLPVGLLPNGEYLIPRDDEDSGGVVIARVRILK